MDVHQHRASAATSDPKELAVKVAAIKQRLRMNRAQRYARLIEPTNEAEAFAIAEQGLERERDRGI
jgi:hypothetical protein